MLAVLQRRGIAAKPERITEIRIDLRPRRAAHGPLTGLRRRSVNSWRARAIRVPSA